MLRTLAACSMRPPAQHSAEPWIAITPLPAMDPQRFTDGDTLDIMASLRAILTACHMRLHAAQHMASFLQASPMVYAEHPLFQPHCCLWQYPTSGEQWDYIVLGEWDDDQWLCNFRMTRATFMELCRWLAPALRHQDTCMWPARPLKKQVAIALWKLDTLESNCSVGYQFGMGKATTGVVLLEVVATMNRILLCHLIRLGDVDTAMAGFQQLGFPNCIGALDSTHIAIWAPPHSQGWYINQKSYHSVILQALVDA